MNELMAVEAALFSAGRALDATEVAEATDYQETKRLVHWILWSNCIKLEKVP